MTRGVPRGGAARLARGPRAAAARRALCNDWHHLSKACSILDSLTRYFLLHYSYKHLMFAGVADDVSPLLPSNTSPRFFPFLPEPAEPRAWDSAYCLLRLLAVQLHKSGRRPGNGEKTGARESHLRDINK